MQTFKRVAIVLSMLLVILAGLVFWKYPEQEAKRLRLDYEVQSPEDLLLKHEAQILEDLAVLEKVDFFRGSKGTKDAAPWLNTLVVWEKAPTNSGIKFSDEVMRSLHDKDWVVYVPQWEALKHDFGWMKKLHDYDHWAYDLTPPRLDPAERKRPEEMPMPEYRYLIAAAKLRLIHGRVNKDLKQALADVRQLARLIYTNDTLVSSAVAIAMLRNENKFVQAFNPKISEGWVAVPDDVLVRAKRYVWAQAEFVDPRLSDETYERFSGGNDRKCMMLSEGMMDNLLVRDHLKNLYPRAVKRFDETVKNALTFCRKSVMHLIWEDPQWKALGPKANFEDGLVKPENVSEWQLRFLMIHPRAEEIFGLSVLNISGPNYLKQYQELPPKNPEE